MMIVLSLFPSGVLQLLDVVQNGYWHARSIAYTGTARLRLIEWLRLPGDLVFISSIPMTIAAIKGWLGIHAIARSTRMS